MLVSPDDESVTLQKEQENITAAADFMRESLVVDAVPGQIDGTDVFVDGLGCIGETVVTSRTCESPVVVASSRRCPSKQDRLRLRIADQLAQSLDVLLSDVSRCDTVLSA